jgi:inosine-uridine nucleoside N-ribohydrolase
MTKTPIILDCDTGVDDAIAIMLAHKVKHFDIRAVTTVAGNVPLEKTTLNTLRVLELIEADIPVYKGAHKPMFHDLVTAEQVHGQDGLGGINLPAHQTAVADCCAWDALYKEAKRCDGALEVITIGPLTNLGMAFTKYRDLPELIRRIIMMGGSATGGNITPAAEFNIYVDPEAADIVFCSGVQVYMCGLDVTSQAYYTADDLEHVSALGSKPSVFFRDVAQDILTYSIDHGSQGICMHDPLTVLYAADDSIFSTHHVWIRVETKGLLTKGKTVTDLYSDKKMEKNAYIVTDVDHFAFQKIVYELMAEYEN